MSVQSAARAERRRFEDAYRKHVSTCWDCFRQSKGRASRYCDIGAELLRYLELMEKQVELLKMPQPEAAQDTLF